MSNSLRCNIQLNELFREKNVIAEIAEQHASDAVTLLSLRHPVFSQKDFSGALRLIYQFACTPENALVSWFIVHWLPNAAHELTVEELFYDELHELKRDRARPRVYWDRNIYRHYRFLVPDLEFQ